MPAVQFPVINAGTTYTASLLASMIPFAAVKGADTPVTSSITLINDPDLSAPLAANGIYSFEALANYTTGTPGSSDMKGGWTVPAGASLVWGCVHYGTGGSLFTDTVFTSGQTLVFYGNGTAQRSVFITGTVTNGATAGPLQFQWAQNAIFATPTVLKAGSLLSVRRLA